MTKTNFLTVSAAVDAFWKEGAFLQLSAERFKLFCGSFSKYSSFDEAYKQAQIQEVPVLYYPTFWGFLGDPKSVTDTGYWVPEQAYELTRQELLNLAQKSAEQVTTAAPLISWKAQPSELFKKQFDWIQKSISHEGLMKALPISQAVAEGDISPRKAAIIAKLLQIQSPNYAYGFWNQNSGVLGYTPEVLSHWSSNTSDFKTMALAGTWAKAPLASYDFASEKVRDEHNYVITDIEKQLKDFQQKYKSETSLVELPHLFHLKTDFTYACKNIYEALNMLQQLHPTAALGMYPRVSKMLHQFSQLSLQSGRAHFGSPFGFLSQTEAFVVVAIRNVTWSAQQIQLYAGCGVTAESHFSDEWNEILSKQASVKKMLGIEN